MSFSSESGSSNPAKFRLEVKSGKVQYYDRDLGQDVQVPEPFEFVVLDQVGTIKGWNDEDGSNYWSNEVKNSGKEEFTIRTQKGVKASGIWKEIKADDEIAGSQFFAVVYLAHNSENGMVISRLYLKGAALKAWIEFAGANRKAFQKNKVVLSDWEDAKKGSVKYKKPVFTLVPIEDSEAEEAKRLDGGLQEYFTQYFNRDTQNESPKGSTRDTVVDDIDDEPINLDDIPF